MPTYHIKRLPWIKVLIWVDGKPEVKMVTYEIGKKDEHGRLYQSFQTFQTTMVSNLDGILVSIFGLKDDCETSVTEEEYKALMMLCGMHTYSKDYALWKKVRKVLEKEGLEKGKEELMRILETLALGDKL
jgi:hypothetical protein